MDLQIGDVAVADVWTARERIVTNAVGRLASTRRVDLEPLAAKVVLDSHVGQLVAATSNVDDAVAAQRQMADAWMRTLTHIRRGQPRAAMAAYEDHGKSLRADFNHKSMSVGGANAADRGRADGGAGGMAMLKAASRR